MPMRGEQEIQMTKQYKHRTSAHRAAKVALKRVFGQSFEAYEGPDYQIHPETRNTFKFIICHKEVSI